VPVGVRGAGATTWRELAAAGGEVIEVLREVESRAAGRLGDSSRGGVGALGGVSTLGGVGTLGGLGTLRGESICGGGDGTFSGLATFGGEYVRGEPNV